VNGSIHGVILGLETYLPKYKSGSEGLIVNISSIAGITPFSALPIYTATKFAITGLTLAWGQPSHYERTKVRVVGICPGVTMTPLITEMTNKNLGPAYEKIKNVEVNACTVQSPEQVASAVVQVIEKAPSGTLWIIEGGEPPYQFSIPDRNNISKVHL